MAKPQSTEAKLEDKSADDTVAKALAAMEAQIAALTAQNEALQTRLSDVGHPVKENEVFKPVDFEDPEVMAMMERRGEVPKHPETGQPIFNPLRAAVRPPA